MLQHLCDSLGLSSLVFRMLAMQPQPLIQSAFWDEGEKAGLRLPLTSRWVELCHVASARTKVAVIVTLRFSSLCYEAGKSKEGWERV